MSTNEGLDTSSVGTDQAKYNSCASVCNLDPSSTYSDVWRSSNIVDTTEWNRATCYNDDMSVKTLTLITLPTDTTTALYANTVLANTELTAYCACVMTCETCVGSSGGCGSANVVSASNILPVCFSTPAA
jgi:hypothetical protein